MVRFLTAILFCLVFAPGHSFAQSGAAYTELAKIHLREKRFERFESDSGSRSSQSFRAIVVEDPNQKVINAWFSIRDREAALAPK
jgi:hypothetical protein